MKKSINRIFSLKIFGKGKEMYGNILEGSHTSALVLLYEGVVEAVQLHDFLLGFTEHVDLAVHPQLGEQFQPLALRIHLKFKQFTERYMRYQVQILHLFTYFRNFNRAG